MEHVNEYHGVEFIHIIHGFHECAKLLVRGQVAFPVDMGDPDVEVLENPPAPTPGAAIATPRQDDGPRVRKVQLAHQSQ